MGKRKKPPGRGATRRKSTSKPASSVRRAFLAQQEKSAYLRRVRYALGRGKPLPEARTKTLAKARDSFVVEYEERNPPSVVRIKKRKAAYYRERKKLEKEGVTNRAAKRGSITSRIYNIPFRVTRDGTVIDREAMAHVFQLEAKFDRPGHPRVVRAYIKAKFRDQKKPFWFSVKYPVLAVDGPDGLVGYINARLAEYAIKTVEEIEVVCSYQE